MPEYFFEHKNADREAILQEFEAISDALNCSETFHFTFETDDLASLKSFLSKVNDSDSFRISAEGKWDLRSSGTVSPLDSLLSDNRPELFNLSLKNQAPFEGDPEDEWMHDIEYPLIDLVVISGDRPTQISIRMEDEPKESKSKKKQLAKTAFRAAVFNAWFQALNINAQAMKGISDGSDYRWLENNHGILIQSADNQLLSTLQKSVINDALGCKWLTIYPESTGYLQGAFEALLTAEFFSKRSASFSLWGKSVDIIGILEATDLPVESFSNIVSEEIAADKSLLNAFREIEYFEGDITLIRPYSFNNSMSDTLNLRLDQDELYCFVDTGMTAKSTRTKFLKQLSKKLGRDILFEED